jgi:large subunit ribosomal protein L25
MITLNVTKRQNADSLDMVRKNGSIPAVFYGRKEESTPISVALNDFNKVWKEAGESSVVMLKGDGIELDALIQDVDLHPVTGVPRHADFYVLEKGKKVKINVPLEFDGVSPAVKDLGGTLVKVLHELEIEALPKDFPHTLTVNIAGLETLESQILAQDVSLPSGVELITKPEEVVAAISVAVEEPVDAPAMSIEDIEVSVEKGKKPDEDTAAAADAPKAAEPKDK